VVLMRLFRRFKTITTVFAYGGYTCELIGWAKKMFGYTLQIVKRSDQKGYQVSPNRWIVECTFAWLNWSRSLS
jgi:putative transposase